VSSGDRHDGKLCPHGDMEAYQVPEARLHLEAPTLQLYYRPLYVELLNWLHLSSTCDLC